MTMKTMPGLGLGARWDLGENGWNVGMDESLARLSALAQLSVPSLSAALDTGAGVQIAPAVDPNAGKVGAHIDGEWWFVTPPIGTRAFVRDQGRTFVLTASGWLPASEVPAYVVTGAAAAYVLTEAEFVAGAVVVVNSGSDVVVTIPAGGGVVSPGSSLGRRPVTIIQAGVGRVAITGASGVTVNAAGGVMRTRVQHSVASIIPVSATGYVVCGDLAA